MLAPMLNLVAIQSAINNLSERIEAEEPLETLAPELSEVSFACKNLKKKAA